MRHGSAQGARPTHDLLYKRGGPNHVNNFCLAPVMVDGETDTVYYTPLFYVVKQVSRRIASDSGYRACTHGVK